MTTLVRTFMKENGNASLEAQIHETDMSYSVKYFINGSQVRELDFPSKSLQVVEAAVQTWLSGARALNG
jgi:hypothetical protein